MKHLLGILFLTVVVFLVVVTGAIAMDPFNPPVPEDPPEANVIVVNLDIYPGTINLKSNGKYIDVYIELPPGPPGHDAANIDLSSVVIGEDCWALTQGSKVGDKDDDGIPDLRVRFDGNILRSAVGSSDMVELTIRGSLSDETPFVGSDVVRIKR